MSWSHLTLWTNDEQAAAVGKGGLRTPSGQPGFQRVRQHQWRQYVGDVSLAAQCHGFRSAQMLNAR